MSLRLTRTAAAALLLTAALAPVAASAETGDMITFRSTVEHSDLDLTTDAGVARLDDRVRSRIRKMCEFGGRDLTSLKMERECRDRALASTAPAIRMAISNAKLDRVQLADGKASSPAATPGV